MEKTKVTWRGVMTLCGKIVKKLKDKYPNVLDYEVVGLSRGGLIPAVIISNMLNIRKVYSIGLKSYVEQEKSHAELYQVPNFSEMSKVLLIDDISDTGDSFLHCKEMLVNKDLITASLFLKEKTKFVPDIIGKKVVNDNWVVFPWE